MRFIVLILRLAVLFSALLLWTTIATNVRAEDAVKVCDDISPWPPYSYPSPIGNRETVPKQTGAMVGFLGDLFKEVGLKYTLTLRPWKRCLEEVKKSSGPGEFEVVINASFSSERAKDYHISKPIYRTTPGIFYSVDAYPAGLNLRSRSDLKKYKICGVRGYNYQEYGLSDSDIYTVAPSLKAIFRMMSKGRCEIIVSAVEVVFGTKLFGEQIAPNNVRSVSVPGTSPETYHLLISRNSSRGFLLLKRLNIAIDKFKNDGTRDRIMAKYQTLMDAN